MVIPYIKGTSDTIRRVFNKYNVNVSFKPHQTLRRLLVHPKDKTKKAEVCGAIYRVKCGGSTNNSCKEDYIGETERSVKARFNEHRRPSSHTSEVSKHIHSEHPSHKVALDQVDILDREQGWFQRGVKESIYIRSEKPTLNKDGGRHNLSHIYDAVLTPTQHSVKSD